MDWFALIFGGLVLLYAAVGFYVVSTLDIHKIANSPGITKHDTGTQSAGEQ